MQLMTQVLTPVADRFGTYHLIMGAAGFKLLAAVLMFVAGRRAWPVWTLLFLGNRLAATAWGFYNLSFSDVSFCWWWWWWWVMCGDGVSIFDAFMM